MGKYVIIYDTTDFIMCRGVFDDYEKALGHLMILMDEEERSWRDNGYEITKRDDFFDLECDSGYGWEKEWDRKDPKIHISEKWFLLFNLEDKDDGDN